MKLSEMDNDRVLDIIADILEPGATILADKEVGDLYRAGKKLLAVKAAIKSHKKEIKEILATMDGVPVEELKINFFTLPSRVLELFNEPEVLSLFSFPSQTERQSGNTSETTTDADK